MKYLIDFALLDIIYFLVFFRRWKTKGRDVLFVNTIIYIYLSFVLFFTLMPITVSLPQIFSHPYSPMELIPFSDLLAGRGDFIRQIVLNIIMTVPFGFLFPLVKSVKTSFITTVVCCFIFSLIIELLQPLINGVRSSDITDLITNTFGAIIGYLLYLLFRPLTAKLLKFLGGK